MVFWVIKNVISFMFNLGCAFARVCVCACMCICVFFYLVLCVLAICMQIYRNASVSQTNSLGKRIYIGHYGNGFGRRRGYTHTHIWYKIILYVILCVCVCTLIAIFSCPFGWRPVGGLHRGGLYGVGIQGDFFYHIEHSLFQKVSNFFKIFFLHNFKSI